MAIGGAMDHEDPVLAQEFIHRAGGASARIVILPQASALPDTGENYVRQFLKFGAGQAAALEFRHRAEAGTAEQLDLLRKASGIFFAGGTQMRLAVLYGGTRLEEELLAAYQRGCVIGGTSAGAAILSKTMIAYGKGGPTPREGMLQFSAGLGFTDKFIFDQHFRQRDRLGRLIYAVATNPGVLGIGLDENTAVIIEDDRVITVRGIGAVTVVDGRQISNTDVAEIEKRGAVAVSNLIIHVLTDGCRISNNEVFIPDKLSESD